MEIVEKAGTRLRASGENTKKASPVWTRFLKKL
jgi:hypothetical protein